MTEITKDNFSQEVVESGGRVLVDVWGPSCQPCLALMPEVEKLARELGDQVKVVKLNSAQNRRLCIDLRVMGLPAFILFKDGQEVSRISGKDVSIEDVKKLALEN